MQEHRSPLPQEPEYWNRLAERIGRDAAAPLADYATAERWYGALARQAPWLVAAAAAVIVALLLTLPAAPDSSAYRWIETSLVPEEAAGSLIAGPTVPTVPELLPAFSPTSLEEVR